GARRLRRSTRRAVRRTVSGQAGPAVVLVLAAVIVLLLGAHAAVDVVWWPQPRAPLNVSGWPGWLRP
ncbi:MAG: hypothetical protein M3P83_09145, partial [Actinomycetota bacterium]|nr:hypothetical protein [Actinomycetota bacterium]